MAKTVMRIRAIYVVFSAMIATTAFLGHGNSATAAAPTIVACPSIHPFRVDVPLLRASLTGRIDPKPGKWWEAKPFEMGGPPAIHAKDGWAYVMDDRTDLMDALVCTYADESTVSYPLPPRKIRGLGTCHFVEAWAYEDMHDKFLPSWPYGVERKPMALCTFEPDAVIRPDFKPPSMNDD